MSFVGKFNDPAYRQGWIDASICFGEYIEARKPMPTEDDLKSKPLQYLFGFVAFQTIQMQMTDQITHLLGENEMLKRYIRNHKGNLH